MSDLFRPLQPVPGSREWSKETVKLHFPYEEHENPHLRYCGNCNNSAKNLPACAGCAGTPLTTFYCNRQCQRANWEMHKIKCKEVRFMVKNYLPPTSMKLWRQFAHHPYKAGNVAIHWAALQAFMANPQHNIKKTYVKIKVKKFKLENIEINLFPVYFGFSPLSLTTPLPKERLREEDYYGYWSAEVEGPWSDANPLLPIRSVYFPSDFMRQPIPQWPYILAKVLQANENQAKNSLEFLIYIIKTVLDHKNMDCGLEEFAAPKIDDLWYTDIDKFYRWMRLTRNVVPV